MGTQLRTQKKYPAPSVETHRAFKSQGFTVQTQLDTASQPQQRAVDWQTQLSRAKRFGHNLSQVQVHPNPAIQRQVPITQRKSLLQRSVVDEEQERDEESSEMQMKSDREQNSLLKHLPTYNPHTRSRQSVLGNELTHVVQQRAGRVPVPSQSKEAPVNADPALKQEGSVVT
jgi:hypothetical protein